MQAATCSCARTAGGPCDRERGRHTYLIWQADGVIVKEMSEAAVIAKLEKDLKELEATTGRRK